MSVIYWEMFCAETENVEFYDLCRKNIIHVTLTTVKSSQTTQLYITKVFDKQFSCHDYIRKSFFVTNFDKINIFWLRLIRQLKQDATRDVWYYNWIVNKNSFVI
jgi:hypothetical protein